MVFVVQVTFIGDILFESVYCPKYDSNVDLFPGDQVLEWNGIELTGKSFEEVQQIIAQPNGEIELVVRP